MTLKRPSPTTSGPRLMPHTRLVVLLLLLGGALADAIGVVGNVTISVEGSVEGTGAATSDSGLEVSAGEGAGIIMVDNLEIALADPLRAAIFEVASTTSPTIVDGGTDLGIISEISPNPT